MRYHHSIARGWTPSGRRPTRHRRIVAAALVGLACLVADLIGGASAGGPVGHPASAASASRGAPDQGLTVGGAARRVIVEFSEAWWGSDWREAAVERRGRLAALVTPTFDAQLGPPDPAPVLDDAGRRAHRTVSVGPPELSIEDAAADQLGVAVTAPVTARTSGAAVTGRLAMEVLVVRTGGRWLIAEVDQ